MEVLLLIGNGILEMNVIKEFNAPPFQHTYDSVGDYDVKLIVTDAKGCTDQITERAFVKFQL
jgi:PKD repeat protein